MVRNRAMKPSVLTEFGRRVRARRKAAGLSQEELAERAGLHRTYVGGVERGERNTSLLAIERIAQALGCSMSNLMPDWKDHHGVS